jgi:hypothetical protein
LFEKKYIFAKKSHTLGRINQEIVEYSFSAKSTLSYELSILVGADSIYYMVNDAQLNILALKTHHFDHNKASIQLENLRTTFFDDSLLKESYRVIKIVFTTPHFTLIPSKFYNDSQRQTYFKNLNTIGQNDFLETDNLKNIGFYNIYQINKPLLEFTKSLFNQSVLQYHHIFTALIEGCRKIAELRTGHQLFANIRDNQVQILFFDGKELIFANGYTFKTNHDLIYFILMVYEQFKLNPEVIPLSISGSLTQDSEIYKIIFRYIRHLHFIQAPPYFRFGNQFTGVPQHFYFDLFSIKLCE